MNRAQISLDLMLAVVVFGLFVASLQGIEQEIAGSKTNAIVEIQLLEKAKTAEKLIVIAKTIEGARLSYEFGEVKNPVEGKISGCEISAGNGTIIVVAGEKKIEYQIANRDAKLNCECNRECLIEG